MQFVKTHLMCWAILVVGNLCPVFAQVQELSDCVSESFDESKCFSAIKNVENAYPNYSAPDELLKNLADAYHNMAYVGPAGTARDAWANRGRDLFEVVLKNAGTSQRLYLASTIAPTQQAQEDCLRQALAIDPNLTVARRDLIQTLLEQKQVSEALSEWRFIQKSEPLHRAEDALDGIRIANLLAAHGDLITAQDIITDVVDATTEMDSIARCYLFQAADIGRLGGDQRIRAQIEGIRRVCEDVQHRNAGVAAMLKGNKSQAVAELEAQIRENPGYSEAYFLLEKLYRSTGREEDALRTIKALFNSTIKTQEKCAGIGGIPLGKYARRSPELVQQVQKTCFQ